MAHPADYAFPSYITCTALTDALLPAQDWNSCYDEELLEEYLALAKAQLATVRTMQDRGENVNKQVGLR